MPESRDTPPSGVPAAVAATRVARSSVEISTSRAGSSTTSSSSRTDDDDTKRAILTALDALRTEMSARFERVERTTAAHGRTLQDLTNQVAKNTTNIAEQSAALTSVAKSAAIAAELSAQALARVGTVQDDTRKMVESAMSIQKAMVSNAVTEGLKPVREDVELLKSGLTAVVNELGIEDRVGRRDAAQSDKDDDDSDHPGRHTTALAKLDNRTKHSTIAHLVISIAIVVEAIWRFWHHP